MSKLQIIYASAAAVPFSQTDLESLLLRARVNNAKLGISGMLLHHDGAFLQVLEGPAENVQPLFDKITTDPRQKNLVLLLRRTVEEASFEGWSMGFVNAEHHDLSDLPGYLDYNQAAAVPIAQLNADLAWRVLDGFRHGK